MMNCKKWGLSMTEDEKNIIKMYLINEGNRLHVELLDCKSTYDARGTTRTLIKLLEAAKAKEAFDKFNHDLCALLNI